MLRPAVPGPVCSDHSAMGCSSSQSIAAAARAPVTVRRDWDGWAERGRRGEIR
jgi:hypothetical protein